MSHSYPKLCCLHHLLVRQWTLAASCLCMVLLMHLDLRFNNAWTFFYLSLIPVAQAKHVGWTLIICQALRRSWNLCYHIFIHCHLKVISMSKFTKYLIETTICKSAVQITTKNGLWRPLVKLLRNKTIRDEGITVDFWIIKVHTSNWSSKSWGSSNG